MSSLSYPYDSIIKPVSWYRRKGARCSATKENCLYFQVKNRQNFTLYVLSILDLESYLVNFVYCILQFLQYSPKKILKIRFTIARPKDKSRLHYNIAHLHTPVNIHAKHQLPISYIVRDIAKTESLSQSTTAKSKVKTSLHHYVAHLHLQPLSQPSMKFLYL